MVKTTTRYSGIPPALLVDKECEREGEQGRPENPGEAGQAADRALQLALFRFAYAARHHPLRRRARDRPEHHHRNREKEISGGPRQTGQNHSECAEKLADIERPPFAEARNDRLHHARRNDNGTGAHQRERKPDHSFLPGVTKNRVERPDVENFVRDVADELDRGEPE